MARKVEALQEVAKAIDDVTLSPDMSAAECIHVIAELVNDFVKMSGAAIRTFDARIKALEDKG